MEAFAISKLKSYVNKELNVRIVGFSINHFSEINEIYGKEKRGYAFTRYYENS